MAFRPYLAFAGNCREAFTRYQKVFGGELVLLTVADVPAEAEPPTAFCANRLPAGLSSLDVLL